MTLRQFIAATLCAALIVLAAAAFLSSHALASTCVLASHYGAESGSRTANGERFTGKAMTAAHRSLPFNTRLRVTYQGRSVVVRINDRGPFIRGRSLDLSTGAARKLGMVRAGVARVCYERIS
jgi:rare lipoprotein A